MSFLPMNSMLEARAARYMDLNNFSVQLFKGQQVQILGTPEEPLIDANALGALVGYKRIGSAINSYDSEFKREVITTVGGKTKKTVLLTKQGVIKLAYGSSKPEARAFRDWLVETLDRGCARAATFDLNDYADEPCVYMLSIGGNMYKFGQSAGVDGRLRAHIANFAKLGRTARIVHIWKCNSADIMKKAEKAIKNYAAAHDIFSEFNGQKEIIKTDDVNNVVAAITAYIDKMNAQDGLKLRETLAALENEKLRLEVEKLRLELQLRSTPAADFGGSADWIAENPPAERELKSAYIARYKRAGSPGGHNACTITRIVRGRGYATVATSGGIAWIRCTQI